MSSGTYLDIENLSVTFGPRTRPVRAVDDVTLRVRKGEAVALIGESGSGKSVTMRAVMRLNPEDRSKLGGRINAGGHDVTAMSRRALSRYRGAEAAMIFQEPLLALDPVYTIGAQISETILRHEKISRADAWSRALDLFERVQIPSPERRLRAYPHELSGGMRQRAMIALALACWPQLLLADEPTTALDASVQIQVLLLLRRLQRELGLSIIFVTHDIGAAVEVADRIAVMYAGRIVEEASARDLIRAPRHPYTIGLLRSRTHDAMRKGHKLDTIPGAPPDLANLPAGCAFAPRCFLANDRCHREMPGLESFDSGRTARCLRLDRTAPDALTRAG